LLMMISSSIHFPVSNIISFFFMTEYSSIVHIWHMYKGVYVNIQLAHPFFTAWFTMWSQAMCPTNDEW
jgi:hypothetical protein